MRPIDDKKRQMTAKEAVDALERIMAEAADEWIGDWEDYWAFDLAIQALQRSKWTPCSERLPESQGYYICTCKDGSICRRTTTIKWSNGWQLSGRRAFWTVAAWMPLPEPWEGADDE